MGPIKNTHWIFGTTCRKLTLPESGWEIMARLRRRSISEGGARNESEAIAASSVVEKRGVLILDFTWDFGARNADAL